MCFHNQKLTLFPQSSTSPEPFLIIEVNNAKMRTKRNSNNLNFTLFRLLDSKPFLAPNKSHVRKLLKSFLHQTCHNKNNIY